MVFGYAVAVAIAVWLHVTVKMEPLVFSLEMYGNCSKHKKGKQSMLKIHIGNFGVILLFSLSNLKTFVATFLNSKDTFDLITILKPIWNPVEKLWIKYIETALASKDDEFEAINEKAKNELGESFLQFAGRTGKFHLSKVNNYELNMYRGISWYTFTRYIV